MRDHVRQRGEGRLGTFISLGLLAVFGLAVWNVGPVYISDYTLADHMIQTARRPVFIKDQAIRDLLMEEVKNQGLRDLIQPSDFKILRRDGSRKIELKYERTVEVLPNWKHTFKFEHVVDERTF
jgi:hypothetical protein